MNEDRRLQIYAYIEAYFGGIRTFLDQNRHLQPKIPEIFKSHYLHVVYECSDGYVVASYLAQLDDNYLYADSSLTVSEQMGKLPNKILGTTNHAVLRWEQKNGADQNMFAAISDRVETTTGPVPTTGWKFLWASSRSFAWAVEEAKESTKSIIEEFKARGETYVTDDAFILSFDDYLTGKPLIEKLRLILEGYKQLLNDPTCDERRIHDYLNDHNVLFFPQKKRLVYEVEFRRVGEAHFDHKADFIVEPLEGSYVLVELESPRHELFLANEDFTAQLRHAEKQVQDWFTWLRKYGDQMSDIFPKISFASEGLVVMGRSSSLTEKQKEAILMHNEKNAIKLLTYDHIAEQAEQYIAQLEKLS